MSKMTDAQLLSHLKTYFDEEELWELCFSLKVDYELLPGEGRGAKSRGLIQFLERRDRKQELISEVLTLRPHLGKEDKIDLDADTLFKKALKLQIGGNLGEALQLFNEVKTLEPFYPNIDSSIKAVEVELSRSYVDLHGHVNKRALYLHGQVKLIDLGKCGTVLSGFGGIGKTVIVQKFLRYSSPEQLPIHDLQLWPIIGSNQIPFKKSYGKFFLFNLKKRAKNNNSWKLIVSETAQAKLDELRRGIRDNNHREQKPFPTQRRRSKQRK